jgi:hypothetical protein
MADDTFASESSPRASRTLQRFGTVVVVGGGCYGSHYVRQLHRAELAGALAWRRLVVVDRDPACLVSALPADARPSALEIVTEEWHRFFAHFLADAAERPDATRDDAIVPSPLMPHLMADWLAARAGQRWPDRVISCAPLGAPPAVPWQRAGDDGTHYVSFAEWMCPINCIEPPRCPHTRGERTWTMPAAVAAYAASERDAGRPVEGPYVFHCAHRAFGVGMLDVRDVVAADRAVAERGAAGAKCFLVGTVSHCHGALRRIVIDDAAGVATGGR